MNMGGNGTTQWWPDMFGESEWAYKDGTLLCQRLHGRTSVVCQNRLQWYATGLHYYHAIVTVYAAATSVPLKQHRTPRPMQETRGQKNDILSHSHCSPPRRCHDSPHHREPGCAFGMGHWQTRRTPKRLPLPQYFLGHRSMVKPVFRAPPFAANALSLIYITTRT